MIETLIPGEVTARGRSKRLGFGLTGRALVLLLTGLLAAVPAFYHPGRIWMMVVWDVVIAGLIVWDAWLLPAPDAMR